MSIDPAQIELTAEQKQRLVEEARRVGEDYSTLIDRWLGITTPRNSLENWHPKGSMLQAMKEAGAWGCIEGPGDLSTNPKHMEGFGTNASHRRSTD